jgi:hypothetical protein
VVYRANSSAGRRILQLAICWDESPTLSAALRQIGQPRDPAISARQINSLRNQAWVLKKYVSKRLFGSEYALLSFSSLSSAKWWLAEQVFSVG